MKLIKELVNSGLVKKTDLICEAFYSAGTTGSKIDASNVDDESDGNDVGKYVPQGGDYSGPQDEAAKKLIAELSVAAALSMKSAKSNVLSILSNAGAKLTDQMRKNISEISTRLDSDADYLVKLKNDFGGDKTGESEEDHMDDTASMDKSDNKSMVPDIKDDVLGIDAMIQ